MKIISVVILLFVCGGACKAESYFEIGAFHLNRAYYYFDENAAGVVVRKYFR